MLCCHDARVTLVVPPTVTPASGRGTRVAGFDSPDVCALMCSFHSLVLVTGSMNDSCGFQCFGKVEDEAEHRAHDKPQLGLLRIKIQHIGMKHAALILQALLIEWVP